jgi:hypothetical protein
MEFLLLKVFASVVSKECLQESPPVFYSISVQTAVMMASDPFHYNSFYTNKLHSFAIALTCFPTEIVDLA